MHIPIHVLGMCMDLFLVSYLALTLSPSILPFSPAPTSSYAPSARVASVSSPNLVSQATAYALSPFLGVTFRIKTCWRYPHVTTRRVCTYVCSLASPGGTDRPGVVDIAAAIMLDVVRVRVCAGTRYLIGRVRSRTSSTDNSGLMECAYSIRVSALKTIQNTRIQMKQLPRRPQFVPLAAAFLLTSSSVIY